MEPVLNSLDASTGTSFAADAVSGLLPWVLVGAVAFIVFVNLRKRARASHTALAQTGDAGLAARLSDADLASYQLDDVDPPKPAEPLPNLDDFFSNSDRRAELQGEAAKAEG